MAHEEDPPGEVVIPKSADIKRALACVDPDGADDGLAEKMEFFLNVVLPAIDPRMQKAELWLATNCSHVEWFGAQQWTVEVATGMVLLDHFSNLGNITHNLGIAGDDDSAGEEEGASNEEAAPTTKKKKQKMHTKTLEQQLESEILRNQNHCRGLVGKPDFEARMLKWDKRCCKEREKAANETAPRLANHVPPLSGAADNNEFDGSFLDCVNQHDAAATMIATATRMAGV